MLKLIFALLSYTGVYAYFIVHPEYLVNYPKFLSIQAIAFLFYFLLAYFLIKAKQIPWVIVFLCTIFVLFVFSPREFFISKDAYRYVWDGMLVLNGENPYLYVPEDPTLTKYWQIPSNSDSNEVLTKVNDLYKKLDWKGLYTPYPPLAQIIFVVSYILYIPFGIVGAKAVFIFPIFLLAYLLYKHKSEKLSVLLILNPLVVSEIYYSAHIDSYSLLFIYLGVVAFEKGKLIASSIWTSSGFVAKLYPAFLVPFFAIKLIKERKVKQLLLSALCFFSISIIAWLPFTIGKFEPIQRYLTLPDEQEYNASVYRWSYQWIDKYVKDFKVPEILKDSSTSNTKDSKIMAKYISLFVLICGTIYLLTKKYSVNILLAAAILYLFVSPVVFPWYTLFLIPLVFLTVQKHKNYKLLIPLFLMQAIVAWAYFEPKEKGVRDLMLNIEYVVALVLVIVYFIILKNKTFMSPKTRIKSANGK